MLILTGPHQPPNRAAPESAAVARHLAGFVVRQAVDEAPHCVPGADLVLVHADAAGAIEAVVMQCSTQRLSPQGVITSPC